MLSPSVNSLKFQPCDHPSIPLSFSLANPKTRPYSLKLKGIDRSYLCLALVSFRRSHSWKEVVSFRQFLSVSALRPPSLLPVSGPGEFPRVESAYAAGSTPDSVNCFKFQPCDLCHSYLCLALVSFPVLSQLTQQAPLLIPSIALSFSPATSVTPTCDWPW